MKVVVYCPVFLPHIGGLEFNVAHLAEGIAAASHEVVVVTKTPSSEPDSAPYRVVRRPTPWALLRLVRWCDVFFQANVSLRGWWPLLLVRRLWVVSHHGWYSRPDGSRAWQDRLKRWLIRFSSASISVSEALAADLETPSIVIPNSYRDRLFVEMPGVERSGELLFVGRLVSDKGVDVLIDALALLAQQRLRPQLDIVGYGPELDRIEAQVARLGLGSDVRFLGVRTGAELVRTMNEHRILVVPSRYNEPFGIVALEGIACGCLVVGSEGGGLKEAIGECGMTFRNGDAEDLARVLATCISAPPVDSPRRREVIRRHLKAHCSDAVLSKYLEVLSRLQKPAHSVSGGEVAA